MSDPVRFFAGGGEPPRSHEVLIVAVGGKAWYLTGMPWPAQPPFDEIGAYRADLGPPAYERLVSLARAVLDAPEAPPGKAGAGTESVRVGERRTGWSPNARPAEAEPLVAAARDAIAATRREPVSTVAATLTRDGLRLYARGGEPLPVRGVEIRTAYASADPGPSPWDFAASEPAALTLPDELAAGATVDVDLPPAPPPDDAGATELYAFVNLEWRSPLPEEGEWLDGWLIAGPR